MLDIKKNKLISVEVAYVENSNHQFLKNFKVKYGTTAIQAIKISNVLAEFNYLILSELIIGIFSTKVPFGIILEDGDRVEIYRKLLIDPKDNRKIRALKNNK